ncbi:MAG TPA: hypothetical protein VFC37_06750 [Terracidiphilus sp.]|nr:hypothetical protein [Terracidiphilus sp.]
MTEAAIALSHPCSKNEHGWGTRTSLNILVQQFQELRNVDTKSLAKLPKLDDINPALAALAFANVGLCVPQPFCQFDLSDARLLTHTLENSQEFRVFA